LDASERILITMNRLIIYGIIGAAVVVGALTIWWFWTQSMKAGKVAAQKDEQLFKECRSKTLAAGEKMSELGDRAQYEDVRTEVNAIMTEVLVIQSDCESVKDRLMQDPAVQYQNEYFMERAKEFQ
jgi:hypothetical protein